MAEPTPAPDGSEDFAVNIHSAAPSQLPESELSEVTEPARDAETLEAVEKDIKRDHIPHVGATG